MAAPTPVIHMYFDMSGTTDGYFVLDVDELDGDAVLLGGDVGVDITDVASVVSITRGRNRELDEFTAGSATLVLRNEDRTFDPTHVSGPYFGQILPGKEVWIYADGVPIFRGVTRDWSYEYTPGSTWSQASVQVVDALAVLAAKDFDAWTTSSQVAGARINAVLERPEVDYQGPRIIDSGVETLQADNVTWGSNVLNYLQLVARSDWGRLFASRANAVVFRDRNRALNESPAVTFAPDGAGVRYHGVRMELGATFLYNRVSVDREGGTAQTVEDTAAQAATGLGVLSLSQGGLLLTSDARSLALAQHLLGLYSEPELRIAEVVVKLEDDGLDFSDRQAVLLAEIGDVVRVRFAPDGVNTDIDFLGIVEGIRHDLAPMTHQVTLSLSAAESRSFFTLDHPIFGVLDGPGVLAF